MKCVGCSNKMIESDDSIMKNGYVGWRCTNIGCFGQYIISDNSGIIHDFRCRTGGISLIRSRRNCLVEVDYDYDYDNDYDYDYDYFDLKIDLPLMQVDDTVHLTIRATIAKINKMINYL